MKGVEDEVVGAPVDGGLEIESQPSAALTGMGVPSSCRKTTGDFFADFFLNNFSLSRLIGGFFI